MQSLINFTESKRITRDKFEYLMSIQIKGKLTKQNHIEFTIRNFKGQNQTMTLYYCNDTHFATWSKGQGIILFPEFVN